MPVLLVAFVEIHNPERYSEYGRYAAAAVAEFGGQVMSGVVLGLLENCSEHSRVVVVRFETLEAAERFYKSPGYQDAIELRKHAATVRMLVLEDRAR